MHTCLIYDFFLVDFKQYFYNNVLLINTFCTCICWRYMYAYSEFNLQEFQKYTNTFFKSIQIINIHFASKTLKNNWWCYYTFPWNIRYQKFTSSCEEIPTICFVLFFVVDFCLQNITLKVDPLVYNAIFFVTLNYLKFEQDSVKHCILDINISSWK